MEEIEGVANELFVSPAAAEPPEEIVYHRYCPFVPPEAFSVTLPVPQRFASIVVGAAVEPIVKVTGVRELSQVPLTSET